MRVLVLGGRGFIGRHAVDALIARGHDVVVGTRLDLPGDPRVRQAVFERLTRPAHWYPLLRGVDAVVNAVGILRERGPETYDAVHHRAPGALARACAYSGLRLVHVSALGLRASARSRFILSKIAGERAIAASGSRCSIVRPSLVDGEGGFGALWIRWFSRWPVHFVPASASGRIAALDARDLGEAIAVLCERPATRELCEVELGGTERRTMGAYLAALRPADLFPALRVPVPGWMARVLSHLCDLADFSPFSFGHFELLQHDNVPRENLLPVLLGRPPRTVGSSPVANDRRIRQPAAPINTAGTST
jgi:uncharacterized protein YbjT (DUF2867 family)